MSECLEENVPTGFVVQHTSQTHTEQDLVSRADKAEINLKVLKSYAHLHNLRAKVMPSLFSDFKASAMSQLHHKKQLVEGCKDFKDFSSLYEVLSDSHKDTVLAASRAFLEAYGGLTEEFWLQYRALESLNSDRNEAQHCSVADSAAAFTGEALLDLPEQFDNALAMLEALAEYGRRHAEVLDKEAADQYKKLAEITGEVKKKLQAAKK